MKKYLLSAMCLAVMAGCSSEDTSDGTNTQAATQAEVAYGTIDGVSPSSEVANSAVIGTVTMNGFTYDVQSVVVNGDDTAAQIDFSTVNPNVVGKIDSNTGELTLDPTIVGDVTAVDGTSSFTVNGIVLNFDHNLTTEDRVAVYAEFTGSDYLVSHVDPVPTDVTLNDEIEGTVADLDSNNHFTILKTGITNNDGISTLQNGDWVEAFGSFNVDTGILEASKILVQSQNSAVGGEPLPSGMEIEGVITWAANNEIELSNTYRFHVDGSTYYEDGNSGMLNTGQAVEVTVGAFDDVNLSNHATRVEFEDDYNDGGNNGTFPGSFELDGYVNSINDDAQSFDLRYNADGSIETILVKSTTRFDDMGSFDNLETEQYVEVEGIIESEGSVATEIELGDEDDRDDDEDDDDDHDDWDDDD